MLRDHWASLRGWAYRWTAKLMHRFNLHHSRRSGPMEDGVYLHRCEWCGMHRTEVPMSVTVRRMQAERDIRESPTLIPDEEAYGAR